MLYTRKNQKTIKYSLFISLLFFTPSIYPQASHTTLSPVVVTADKSETSADQASAPTYVITEENIKTQGATSLPEVLNNVPGLDVVHLGSPGDDVDIRLRGADRDEVLILLNGVPINATRDHRALFLGNLPVENIERIEIVQGSQSVLYGSDAVGGVINILTKKGSAGVEPFVRFTTGNLGLFKEDAGISGSQGKALWYLSGGREDQRGRFERDRYKGTLASGNFSYLFNPDLQVDIGGQYIHSNQELFYEILTSFDAPTSSLVIRLDPDNNRFLNRDLLATHMQWKAKPLHRVETNLLYGFFGDWDRSANTSTNDTDPAGFTSNPQDFKGHGFRHHIDFKNAVEWLSSESLRASSIIGFEFEDERIGYTDLTSSFPAPGQKGDRQNYAPYLLNTLHILNDRLIVSGGFRWDHSTTFGSEWSPRISVIYKASDFGTLLRGNYSEGFHGPTILDFYNQVLFQATGNSNFHPVRLQAELSQSYEASVEQNFSDRAKAVATFFYIDYDGLLDELQYIPDAYTSGLQVSLSGKPLPNDRVTLGADYTFLEGVNEASQTRLANRPHDRLHLFAEAKPVQRLSIRTDLNVVGNRLIPNKLSTSSGDFNLIIEDTAGNPSGGTRANSLTEEGRTLAGYAKLDLSSTYTLTENKWGMEDWKVFVVIENLLDDQYQEKYGLPAPGISFKLGSSARF